LAFLPSYFQRKIGDRGLQELLLHYSLPHITKGLSLDRPVRVELHSAMSNVDDSTLEISWEASGSTAFPRYNGIFAAHASGERRCRLELQGHYPAPGGLFGRAFDAVAGYRIARVTIAAFLSQIAKAAENDYAARLAM